MNAPDRELTADEQADRDRGTRYADGGLWWGEVCYPDPAAVARCHAEWEGLYGPVAE